MWQKKQRINQFFCCGKNVLELMKKKHRNIPQHNTEQSILVVFRNHPKRN